jgi:rhomboid family GlyGly-CTERM serine protease
LIEVPNASVPTHVPKARLGKGLGWWLIGLALATMVLLWLLGDTVRAVLRFEPVKIQDGEYWRLITGHWVHGGPKHLWFNVFGALFIAVLFRHVYTIKQWIYILVASTVAIDFGFLVLHTPFGSYVGASGVSHGVLAAGAVAWCTLDRRSLVLLWKSLRAGRLVTTLRLIRRTYTTLILLGIVLAKLGWEQMHGALPLVDELPVMVNAHLYGAVGGGAMALYLEFAMLFSRRKVQAAPL